MRYPSDARALLVDETSASADTQHMSALSALLANEGVDFFVDPMIHTQL